MKYRNNPANPLGGAEMLHFIQQFWKNDRYDGGNVVFRAGFRIAIATTGVKCEKTAPAIS
ncbi:hypothetical protein [Paenibacillus phytohabitans]|uniref:hypothetical protein n=1 Tax=Paenibacillus phytohabitans TaxID=2654978 RepID=UPI001491A90F|nr:hypothetical protein [Paenibacillus phytohabitans]